MDTSVLQSDDSVIQNYTITLVNENQEAPLLAERRLLAELQTGYMPQRQHNYEGILAYTVDVHIAYIIIIAV